jgi:hypothetical protein
MPKETQLVLDATDMGWWQRNRDGCPPVPDELVHHSAAGSRLGLNQTEQQQTTGKINSYAAELRHTCLRGFHRRRTSRAHLWQARRSPTDRRTLAEWVEAVA